MCLATNAAAALELVKTHTSAKDLEYSHNFDKRGDGSSLVCARPQLILAIGVSKLNQLQEHRVWNAEVASDN